MLRALTAGAVCFVIGCGAAMRLNGRASALRGMYTALVQMEILCKCMRMPPDAVIASSMAFLPAKDRGEMLAGTEKLPLSGEEKQLIYAVCDALYEHTQEAQQRSIRFAAERFGQLWQAAEEKRLRDAKMYVSLGLLGGLCVFLMCV